MSNGTVRNISLGQAIEFGAVVQRHLPRDLTHDELQYWIGNQKELAHFLRGLRRTETRDFSESWQSFFMKYFGMELDLSEIATPKHQRGFDRVVIVPSGLTINRVIQVCATFFKVYCYYDDLGNAVAHNDREAKDGRHYAIRIRDRVEADEELRSKSANQLKDESVVTMTLMERLILELKYYDETGKHLDMGNATLCAGSRDSDGSVPDVCWHDDKLCVYWCDPRGSDSFLRGRAVVP